MNVICYFRAARNSGDPWRGTSDYTLGSMDELRCHLLVARIHHRRGPLTRSVYDGRLPCEPIPRALVYNLEMHRSLHGKRRQCSSASLSLGIRSPSFFHMWTSSTPTFIPKWSCSTPDPRFARGAGSSPEWPVLLLSMQWEYMACEPYRQSGSRMEKLCFSELERRDCSWTTRRLGSRPRK